MEDYILYVGEDKDFSDRWLTKIVQKQAELPVVLLGPGKENARISHSPILVINRLYASAIYRHGKKNVMKVFRKLIALEKKDVPIINSSKGYLIELDRIKQFAFFNKHHIPYIQISRVNSILRRREPIAFPCVLKLNPSGRNRTLEIVTNKESLRLMPSASRKNNVLQSLIKKLICYRTEFVGDWCATYPQHLCFQKNKLTFRKIYKIVPTPISELLKKKIIKSMKEIGVSAFSIEYFMRRNNLEGIVDFNLTSNYHPVFIKITHGHLEHAWQKLINLKETLWNSPKKRFFYRTSLTIA
ncbi:MAG: hypothetical protein A2117_00075 [Candidatus Wildermuthbacteria bacterium GWA2_46_15]|uniref:ATP-grasp domain-containing protein n=1 Tax=Candidatus Wildermuthbacteria bacterium GWA2_46_15 TaxID=1802443 RepID=A0A1G2QPX0_9BACT|nr:MAG: hypothetical protein A2117_00075 [Candidatus Wildermuthbacteria bacterium GWA2_46_15]